MIYIDSIKIIKYETNEDKTNKEMFVFLAKEGNLFYVWTSEKDWDGQNFEAVRKSSNQSKSLQTSVEVFNFYRDSFEAVDEYSRKTDEEGYND